jgi:hypothetical protein
MFYQLEKGSIADIFRFPCSIMCNAQPHPPSVLDADNTAAHSSMSLSALQSGLDRTDTPQDSKETREKQFASDSAWNSPGTVSKFSVHRIRRVLVLAHNIHTFVVETTERTQNE